MTEWIPFLNDICVIFFDLLIFSQMIMLKKETLIRKIWMYGGCAVILGAYFSAVYIFSWAASVAALICMMIPSLILFFVLSKHKDSRFFLTFCCVDTVSLILATVSRYIGILFGDIGGLIALLSIFVASLTIFFVGRPYFRQYRKLLEHVDRGWNMMTISAGLIYFALVFIAVYPKPLIERPEYGPSYMVFCAVVLSCYAVFITTIIQTNRLYEQQKQLQREKEWHHIAYQDALTGCGNRMAYVEKINELERVRTQGSSICILVFDLDNFKAINDTLGHQAGDRALQAAASILKGIFDAQGNEVFRIGGDEFAVILSDAVEEAVQNNLEQLTRNMKENGSCTFSIGYAFVRAEENNAIEQAFVRADNMMYEEKRRKKNGYPECD